MGFLDKLKDKAKEAKEKAVEAVDEHSPQIKGGIGKAGDFVNKQTKGKYSDKIAKGTKAATSAVDKLDKSDDPNPAAPSDTPAPPAPPSATTPPPPAPPAANPS